MQETGKKMFGFGEYVAHGASGQVLSKEWQEMCPGVLCASLGPG